MMKEKLPKIFAEKGLPLRENKKNKSQIRLINQHKLVQSVAIIFIHRTISCQNACIPTKTASLFHSRFIAAHACELLYLCECK